jgi:hypothetical protein
VLSPAHAASAAAAAARGWPTLAVGFLGGRSRRANARPQALIDSPEITRTIINFKRLLLTDLEVEIPKVPNKKTLEEAIATAGASRSSLAAAARRSLLLARLSSGTLAAGCAGAAVKSCARDLTAAGLLPRATLLSRAALVIRRRV